MASLGDFLPRHEGLLPLWLLTISVIAFANCAQTYMDTSLGITRRVYAGAAPSSSPARTPTESTKPAASAGAGTATSPSSPALSPVNALSARTFGTWTMLSSLIRFYAAYNIDSRPVYELAVWSYVLAAAHFGSEWWYYGTARWTAGLAGPVIVCVVSLPWMLLAREFYVS